MSDHPTSNVTPFASLACPLDGLALDQHGNTWKCANGHSFDTAKQGYIHLLPVQNKRSKAPGDSKEMIQARREFLTTGIYQPIAEATANAVLSNTPQDQEKPLQCLDAGCGEGYYFEQLIKQAGSQHSLALVGVDISKWAVLAAAKQNKHIRWLVGSNAKLPIVDSTLDRVLCMFGFPTYNEFSRVLADDGLLVQVDTGPNHLLELREIIYPTIKPNTEKHDASSAFFAQESQQQLSYRATLASQQDIANLLIMTPHLYRASSEGREKAANLTSLEVTIDVSISTYRKR